MVRPPRAALGLVALLVTGLVVSTGAGAVGVAASGTTEPTESTEARPETTPPSLPPFEPEAIEWTSIGDRLEEGRLDVPIDYANPDAGTFSLYLVRHLAGDPDERIGSLLVNPGGPGTEGTYLATGAASYFTEAQLERFDIVAWDPRGTGASTPFIDCIDNYDEYFAGLDITPETDAERQQAIESIEDFDQQCIEKNEDIIQFVGTNNSARDVDTIRRALGEDEISFYGFSYGSELGATWATLFPDTVRAAVLSGATDPTASLGEHVLEQSAGFEEVLATFLAQCSDDPDCAFHNDGDAEDAFDTLMRKIDEKPLPTEDGRPLLDWGLALDGVGMAMYDEAYWPFLAEALAAAKQGDGSMLLTLYDAYYERDMDTGTWSNFLEAFLVITCMDSDERLTIEEADAQMPQFHEVAPRWVPDTVGDYSCTFLPESSDPRIEITGAGAGPIVVCGTTGDAATPLSDTRQMADTLEDGRLIIVEGNFHTCGNENECANELIDDYLVNLNAPPEVTEC
jgi:pimeloyl-ACP methyl ester carboxylesterase